jgi:hypothetical protein
VTGELELLAGCVRFFPKIALRVVQLTQKRGRLRLLTTATGSAPMEKTIGIVAVAALAASAVSDHSHPPADQISRQFRQPIIVPRRPTEFDRYVLALDKTRFAQAFAKCHHERDVRLRQTGV